MSKVYFVKTYHVYESHSDLFTLAELSGYPVITFDQVDIDSDNVYIVAPLSGEWEKRWDHPIKAEMVLFDLEWRLKESDYAWQESDLVTPPFVKRVWAADKWYAEKIGAQYVPLGSHPGLASRATTNDAWDVASLAYRTGRRNEAFGQMERRGLSISPNAWGDERSAILNASAVVCHVHQHDKVPTVAPLRYAIAAAWHKPLISEAVWEPGIFGDAVLYAEFDYLAPYVDTMIHRYDWLLKQKADELHDLLCVSNSFKSFIQAAL